MCDCGSAFFETLCYSLIKHLRVLVLDPIPDGWGSISKVDFDRDGDEPLHVLSQRSVV